MLLKDFYKIISLSQVGEQNYCAHIRLNSGHAIFKGHFPDHPVTPGVCMMQIVKELTEQILGINLQLQRSSNVKFMALINPEINADLKLDLEISTTEESVYKVKNITYMQDTVALKLVNNYTIK